MVAAAKKLHVLEFLEKVEAVNVVLVPTSAELFKSTFDVDSVTVTVTAYGFLLIIFLACLNTYFTCWLCLSREQGRGLF